MVSWIDRSGIYPYCDIWILTLKRIYAEGLQQRTWEKIGIQKGEPMKRITPLLAIFTVILCIFSSPSITLLQEKPPTWEVYFSPHGGCTDAIVKELNKAKSSILVQAYSFTSAPIAKVLLNAHKRGVKVEVILDKNQRTRQSFVLLEFILNEGIAVC